MYVRKVGRPRPTWASEVRKLALQAAGGLRRLGETISDASAWKNVVDNSIENSLEHRVRNSDFHEGPDLGPFISREKKSASVNRQTADHSDF